MKYSIQCCLLCCLVLLPFSAEAQGTGDQISNLSEIAERAYEVFLDVPTTGLNKSRSSLEAIIKERKRLEQSDKLADNTLALLVADGMTRVLINELHRAELKRMGVQQNGLAPIIEFQKKTFEDLWKANDVNGKRLVGKILRENGDFVNFLKTKQKDADVVLEGNAFAECPKEVRNRIRDMQRRALLNSKMDISSADEALVKALSVLQALEDLDVVVQLYLYKGLPADRQVFRELIDGQIKEGKRRKDSGMKQSSLQVLSTFSRYACADPNAYLTSQTALLYPFVQQSDKVPEQIKKRMPGKK